MARYYFGDGDTVFSLADDLPEPGLAHGSYARLAMKDVDGDGVADIVGLDPVLGGQVWMGNRDNTFTQTDGGEWFGAVGYEDLFGSMQIAMERLIFLSLAEIKTPSI